MRDHPNVLFVITDQQRADHNGCMGNPTLETPHLDSSRGAPSTGSIAGPR